jgi:hypothetical protein
MMFKTEIFCSILVQERSEGRVVGAGEARDRGDEMEGAAGDGGNLGTVGGAPAEDVTVKVEAAADHGDGVEVEVAGQSVAEGEPLEAGGVPVVGAEGSPLEIVGEEEGAFSLF